MNKDLFLSLPERNTNHLITTYMGKITIKHYLNTNLKPYIVGEDKYYKIYVLLRANNKNTKLKSFVSEDEYTQDEFDSIILDKNDIINKYMQIEKDVYTNIISTIESDKRIFDIQVLNVYIQNYGRLLIKTLIEYLKWVKELDILDLELRTNISITHKYRVSKHGIPSISDKYWRSFSIVKHIIEVLSEFVSLQDYKINDDIFIYQWADEKVINDFCAFYERRMEGVEKEAGIDTGKRCIDYINTVLSSIIDRESTENLIQNRFEMLYNSII